MANGVEEHGARLTTAEGEIARLRDWRHKVYISDYNALLLRLLQLEERVRSFETGRTKLWELVRPVIVTLITGLALWLIAVFLKMR